MYLYLAIALLAAAMSGIGTWKVQNWRYAAKEKDRLEQQAKELARRTDKGDTAAVAHEQDKVQIRTRFITIEREVERVVKEKFYVDGGMCFDDAGMHLVTAALASTPAAGEPAPTLSGPDPTR